MMLFLVAKGCKFDSCVFLHLGYSENQINFADKNSDYSKDPIFKTLKILNFSLHLLFINYTVMVPESHNKFFLHSNY